ncbi:hypothetical protein ACFQ2B_40820 [Streptomyces stramineus]
MQRSMSATSAKACGRCTSRVESIRSGKLPARRSWAISDDSRL